MDPTEPIVSPSILILVFAAVPGLISRTVYGQMMRVRQRRERDLLSTISVLIPVSIALLCLAYAVMALPCVPGATCNSFSATVRDDLSNFEHGVSLRSALVWLFNACLLGVLAGAIVGKAVLWNQHPDRPAGHPLYALTGGLMMPVVGASVLTTTHLGSKLLLYSGRLNAIQIGPDGSIDFLVLSGEIRKSLLSDGSAAHSGPFDRGFPVARKPFRRIADPISELNLGIAHTDRLIIESQDIANVHLEVFSPVKGGDFFDQLAYWVGRSTGLIREKEPVPPGPSSGPPST